MKFVLTRSLADNFSLSKSLMEDFCVQEDRILISPLLEIMPREALLDEKNEFSVLIATSAHALHEGVNLSNLINTPLYCVGQKTADAFKRAGGRKAAYVAPNVGALIAYFRTLLPQKALYIRGADVKVDICAELNALGHECAQLISYKACAAMVLSSDLIHALSDSTPLCIMLYSERTASILVDLLASQDIKAPLRFICLSEAVAMPVRAYQGAIVHVAPTPNEFGMCDVLSGLSIGDKYS